MLVITSRYVRFQGLLGTDPITGTFLPDSGQWRRMAMDRADLDMEDLLKIILGLVIVWLLIEVVSEFLGLLFGPLSSVVGLLLLAVLVLWYFDVI